MRVRSAITCVLLLGASLSAAPGRIAAQGFEGVVSVRESRSESDSGRLQTFLIKNGSWRIESPGGERGPTAVIFDPKSSTINVLMAQQKMYMQSPIDPATMAAEEAKKDVSIEKTGRTETVAGYKCEHWIITDKSETDRKPTDICVTRELGGFPMFQMATTRGAPSWMRDVKDVFPLKASRVGDKKPEMEVLKVEKKSLPDAIFLPPSDYKKMDAGAMGRPGMQKPPKP